MHQTQSLIDDIRVRIDLIKTNDRMIKEYAKEQRRRRRKRTDSDLTDFFMDEEFP
jgi:hypothetical protein